MILATLEQFAPPSILSSTYELLSACSMAVPITTISAINITVKQAYHIGSRLQSLSDGLSQGPDYVTKETKVNDSFDVGELLQNVGDALAGLSAKYNIHFIVYHMDNGLHHSHIMGDEAATKHALMHLLRSLFEGCTPGACIELGLNLIPLEESKVRVTFDILLTASPAIPAGLSSIPMIPKSQFTQHLISYVGGTLNTQETESNQVRIQVNLDTFSGNIGDQPLLLIEKPSQILERQLEDVRFSNEPSLKDLTNFVTSLKGVRLVLHAAEKSVFAKHLTSSLTHWNADISHVPLTASYDALVTPRVPQRGKVPSSATSEDHIHSIPPAFILIDDDVVVLENKLREFRERRQGPVRKPVSKRPNENILLQGVTIGVIYFTSLSNYKRVRDTIQYFAGVSMQYPRVVVVTKPAGPRRFLTALHTARINAVVEPHFIPIATSPQSPFVGSSPKSNESSTSAFATPALFTPHLFSPGGKRTPEERSAHYFTPRSTITSPFKETRRHRPQIKVKTPPAPVPIKEEEVAKVKPKMNFNISNRKRKEKNVSSQTSPPSRS
ncbi:hypothetical protein BY458DRAFT_434579 [Sporodiniella umbellata]|nr:hypothetical protein BY458DRAFT_434579 [Sporodiniella umbellata]